MNIKHPSGFMLYHDVLPCLEDISDAEVGLIIKAAITYSISGQDTNFEDRFLRSIWQKVKQAVDRSHKEYYKKCLGGNYAVFCREWKKSHAIQPPSREEWLALHYLISDDNSSYQTETVTEPENVSLSQVPTENLSQSEVVVNEAPVASSNGIKQQVTPYTSDKYADFAFVPLSPEQENHNRNENIKKVEDYKLKEKNINSPN